MTDEQQIAKNRETILRKLRSFEWNPQEDIAAHELALCVPILVNRNFDCGNLVDNLPENAKRHFKEL